MLRAGGFAVNLSEGSGVLHANVPMTVTMECVNYCIDQGLEVHSALYKKYQHSSYQPDAGLITVYKAV